MLPNISKIIPNIIVPIILNNKWTIDALFAFVEAPIDEIIAVIHVPIFIPKVTNKAGSKGIAPLVHNPINIDVVPAELCKIIVSNAPIKINTILYLDKDKISSVIASLLISRTLVIELLITYKPVNSNPIPEKIVPKFFILLFFVICMKTPTHAKAQKNPATGKSWRAIKYAVTVVPILAPIIIAVAWIRDINPVFTKPTTITVVADEDWVKIVVKQPVAIPNTFLLLIFVKRFLSLSPEKLSRFLPMESSPIIKVPRPANNIKMAFSTTKFYLDLTFS